VRAAASPLLTKSFRHCIDSASGILSGSRHFSVHTGTLATCVSQERTLNCPSHQHPPLPSPARSRPYSCSVCGKRFSLKHQMETHYRVHTGMGILPSVNLSFSFPSPACQLLPCPIARRTPSLESLRPFLPSLAFSSTCRREALLL
jgi:uncharacterized Zn-finger protein